MINSIAFSLIALCIIYISSLLKKVTSEYFILLYLRALLLLSCVPNKYRYDWYSSIGVIYNYVWTIINYFRG